MTMNRPYRPRPSSVVVKGALPIVGALLVVACGSAPPPKPPEPVTEEQGPRGTTGPTPQVAQELGSIDQRAVEQTFHRLTQGPLEKCHGEGRSRVEYLTGDVKVFLRVGQDGKVRYGYLEESTLGDRATEKCILDVLSKADWPKPQGGEAEVRNGFGWGPGGERPPTPWGPEKVTGALDDAKDVKKDVAKCKGGVTGDFVVTAYVEHDDGSESGSSKGHAGHGKGANKKKNAKQTETGGKFRSLGISSPSKEGAEKVDCIVDALKELPLPTPGSYAAKVSFPL
jgi:hypothetical protein